MTAACSILSTVAALLLATSTTTAVVAAFSNNDFAVALLAPSPSQRRQLSSSPSSTVVVNNGACYRREYYFHAQQHAMQPTTSSLTRLFYKDAGQTTDEGEIFIRSKRTKLNKNHRLNNNTASQSQSTNVETSSTAIKKKKKKKRSYNLHKKKAAAAGVSITSEELCSHVQSVFSDLKEYENSSSNCDTEEGLDRHQKEVVGRRGGTTMKEQQQHDKGVMKQNSIMLDRHPALVLNADYQPLRMLPLSIWSWQDTVKAVLSGKAVVVDIYPDLYVRAVSLDIPVPSVIALREYAPTGKAKPAFTRRNVFLRDGYRCQYCSNLFRTSDLSLDHVLPRCMGGKLTWENTVTCCKKCNGRKGSLLPTQLHIVGMELRNGMPRQPSLYELAAEAGRFVPRRVHATWEPFLGNSKSSGGDDEEED